jgi:hypothetical protein
MKQSCSNCQFYRAYAERSITGECRRRAPISFNLISGARFPPALQAWPRR